MVNSSNLTVRMTFGNLEGEAKVLLHVMIFTFAYDWKIYGLPRFGLT